MQSQWSSKRNNYGRIQGRRGVALRKARLAREPRCVMCLAEGRVTLATTVDHIIALTNGGTDTDDNVQSLCQAHHETKTAADLGHKAKPTIGVDGWPTT